MSKFKIGADINNYGEVVNLIINLINHSNNFKADFIVRLTNNYIQGCSINILENEVNRMVHNVLDMMQKNGYISYINGMYRIESTNFTLSEYYKHSQAGSIIL